MADPAPTAGTITTFYNGDCPVCRTEVDHYRRIDGRHSLGLGWCDISSDTAAAGRLGVDGEAVKRRLHALDEHGRLHVGVDAFVLLWSCLPRFRWLSRLVGSRAVRPLAAWFYDHVLAAALYALTRRRERRRASG